MSKLGIVTLNVLILLGKKRTLASCTNVQIRFFFGRRVLVVLDRLSVRTILMLVLLDPFYRRDSTRFFVLLHVHVEMCSGERKVKFDPFSLFGRLHCVLRRRVEYPWASVMKRRCVFGVLAILSILVQLIAGCV